MKWNIKKSNDIKLRIAKDEKLMEALSSQIATLFSKHKVQLGDKTYLFEPRIFSVDKEELPFLSTKSREAFTQAVISDMFARLEGDYVDELATNIPIFEPEIGIPSPEFLMRIEDLRIYSFVENKRIYSSSSLARAIVGNKDLMTALSTSVFGILKDHNIVFGENEGCLFTPIVTERPVYAQKVAVAETAREVRGFGPKVLTVMDSNPLPARTLSRANPGLLELKLDGDNILTAGIIIDRWWWIGIPAPEFLQGLRVMRKFYETI